MTMLVLGASEAAADRATTNGPEVALSTRVQVIFDPASGQIARRPVSVVEMFPGLGLSFTWEPAEGPGVDAATGLAEGRGRLVWRIGGAPSYLPDAVWASFEGTLLQGRPEGEGVLVHRSGERYEGGFVAGTRAGQGTWRTETGDFYDGGFRAGLPHGTGRWSTPDGASWRGPFRDGQRHGAGVLRLPGGSEYRIVYEGGRAVSGPQPDAMADALTGGLMKAQSGDAASRVTLSPRLDARLSQIQSIPFNAHPDPQGTYLIYPHDQQMLDAWNAAGVIEEGGWTVQIGEWSTTEAFVDLLLQSQDGQPVTVQDMWLEVTSSVMETKPMPTLINQVGCIGLRPYFALTNHGWGPVERASLEFRFVKPYETFGPEVENLPGTQWFSTEIAPFRDAAIVDLQAALPTLGVDVAGLRDGRFTCQGDVYDWDSCLRQFSGAVAMGELAPFLAAQDRSVISEVHGRLTYHWIDPLGNALSATERLRAYVSFALVENMGLAEQGDAWDPGPAAPQHIRVDFPLDRRNYSYPLDYRGQRTVQELRVPLKLRAPATSIHNFRAAVRFDDGSIRYSTPIRLFYMLAREDLDLSPVHAAQPAQCLPPY